MRDCILLTQHQFTTGDIDCDLSLDSTGNVRMSRTELQQVIVNLILNAVHAMPDGGALNVATADRQDGVVLTVSDSGTGIPPEVRRRIFDPFFTTKQAQGTGLGLSISQQIVSRIGGRITVDSTPGQGSTFTVFLPVEK